MKTYALEPAVRNSVTDLASYWRHQPHLRHQLMSEGINIHTTLVMSQDTYGPEHPRGAVVVLPLSSPADLPPSRMFIRTT
jgi:hypothetical protein